MKYRVEGGVAEIGTDIRLYLTKDQLAVRAHQVEKAGNFYRPLEVIQFKAGEVVNIANKAEDIPGSLMRVLVPANPNRRKSSKKKTAV